jgi:hypothetical protein
MTIVRCPRCRDEVTVPAKATGRALVRCPLCLEEYLLAEALANAPPPLVIIGGEVEQSAIAGATSEGDEYQLAGGPYSAALDSGAPAAPTAAAPRPTIRTAPRPRRQERSGLLLLVNYVVGGVLGLSLGLLVLWWGFSRDPLELGPPIARYLPAIVPVQFRGTAGSDIADGSAAANGDRAAEPTTGGSITIQRRPNGKKETTSVQSKEPPADLQTLPGFEEPAKLPGASLTPAIDAPTLKDRGAASGRTSDDLLRELPRPASAISELPAGEAQTPARPPMPDLTDLLPD